MVHVPERLVHVPERLVHVTKPLVHVTKHLVHVTKHLVHVTEFRVIYLWDVKAKVIVFYHHQMKKYRIFAEVNKQ
jgi:mRNA-degrading endonuclease RelE of RelBE toxin-antitoxin system